MSLKSFDLDGKDEWKEFESVTCGIRLSTCNSIVTGIACDEEFICNGVNLVGLTEGQACDKVGSMVSGRTDAGLGHFVEFEIDGLELLVVDGVVTIASVSADPDNYL